MNETTVMMRIENLTTMVGFLECMLDNSTELDDRPIRVGDLGALGVHVYDCFANNWEDMHCTQKAAPRRMTELMVYYSFSSSPNMELDLVNSLYFPRENFTKKKITTFRCQVVLAHES